MSDTELSPEKDLRWYFPTPVVTHVWSRGKEFNEELRSLILSRESSGDPRFGHIEGGWASGKDFFSWNADCVRTLEAFIQDLLLAAVDWTTQEPEGRVRQYDLQSWANVLRDGGYHAPHSHPNSFWSGVYYVGVGEAKGESRRNGCLELFDPRSATGAIAMPGSILTGACRITPEPGLAVIFPGWLKHMVHPFQGEGERISIAFNLDRE